MATVNFFIISSQRSGSTLIRTSLDSHPEIHCYGEVFLPTYRKEKSYYEYLIDQGASGLSAIVKRRSLTYAFLRHLYGLSTAKSIGFKIMYDQLGYRPYRFPMVLSYARENGIRILHLVRNNSLHSCISRQFARSTGTYHTSETQAQLKLNIDISLLLNEMTMLEHNKKSWRSALSGMSSLEVSYEEFVGRKLETSSQILEFLEVDSSVRLISPLKKVLSSPFCDTITNYDELVLKIKHAGFGRFLED